METNEWKELEQLSEKEIEIERERGGVVYNTNRNNRSGVYIPKEDTLKGIERSSLTSYIQLNCTIKQNHGLIH